MSLRILVVDDSLTFAAAVCQCLSMIPGADVVGECHDGIDALDQARVLLPDLVLLDLCMPGMDGLEVARALRLEPQPPDVIFLSMHEAAAYEGLAQDLGALTFINKADFVVHLLPIIERMVAQKTLAISRA